MSAEYSATPELEIQLQEGLHGYPLLEFKHPNTTGIPTENESHSQ
jgi:hypothetical protein